MSDSSPFGSKGFWEVRAASAAAFSCSVVIGCLARKGDSMRTAAIVTGAFAGFLVTSRQCPVRSGNRFFRCAWCREPFGTQSRPIEGKGFVAHARVHERVLDELP